MNRCPWCRGLDTEPLDDDDAVSLGFCRTHLAEFLGLSVNGLDRADHELALDEFWSHN